MEERLLIKPARDLTQKEAYELFLHHVEQGHIDTVEPLREDEKGNTTVKHGGRFVPFTANDRIFIRPELAGVQFHRASSVNSGDFGSVGARFGDPFNPRPIFAIVLLRLAQLLNQKWNVTKIVWGGIGHGSGKNEKDCHTDGRCLDFYGAGTERGLFFDVRRDWWKRPVRNKTTGKPVAANPKSWDQWAGATKTYYRLAASNDPVDLTPGRFFRDVYSFIQEQCTNLADSSGSDFSNANTLREGNTYHPDYPYIGDPGRAGRDHHNDHMHFQIGKAIG